MIHFAIKIQLQFAIKIAICNKNCNSELKLQFTISCQKNSIKKIGVGGSSSKFSSKEIFFGQGSQKVFGSKKNGFKIFVGSKKIF